VRTRQRQRQSHNQLGCAQLSNDGQDALYVAISSLDRLHRGGEHAVKVRSGYPYPDLAYVNADAHPGSH
jgi:hypothetical protein